MPASPSIASSTTPAPTRARWVRASRAARSASCPARRSAAVRTCRDTHAGRFDGHPRNDPRRCGRQGGDADRRRQIGRRRGHQGSADEATMIVLRGPGPQTQGDTIAGAIDVAAGDRTVTSIARAWRCTCRVRAPRRSAPSRFRRRDCRPSRRCYAPPPNRPAPPDPTSGQSLDRPGHHRGRPCGCLVAETEIESKSASRGRETLPETRSETPEGP